MAMKFSVGMGSPMTIHEVADEARAVEESGFDYLTLVDTPATARDVHVMMTVAAMATRRIGIGHGVVDPLSIHPAVTANAAATIDELSGGRAFIGIGPGNILYKFRRAATLRQMREAITFMRRFMAGEEAEFDGVRTHSRWIGRPLPIYISAHGPKMMQLGGELADGVISLCANPAFVKWQRKQVAKGAERAGRDPDSIDIWTRAMVYITDSKEAARRELSAFPGTYADLHKLLARDDPDVRELRADLDREQPGGADAIAADSKRFADALIPELAEQLDAPHCAAVSQRLIDFFHLAGTPEALQARIEELGSLGTKTVSMTTYTIIDKKAMVRAVGRELIPRFRA